MWNRQVRFKWNYIDNNNTKKVSKPMFIVYAFVHIIKPKYSTWRLYMYNIIYYNIHYEQLYQTIWTDIVILMKI